MNPVLVGVTVVAVGAAAFMLGAEVFEEERGPAEEIGAAVDEAAGDIRRGVEDAAD